LVSWHLARLRAVGLVETRRVGREVVCTLRSEVFDDIDARQRAVLGLARPAEPSTETDAGIAAMAGAAAAEGVGR
jgi:DNA-binding transcriptional ArsR family regulator